MKKGLYSFIAFFVFLNLGAVSAKTGPKISIDAQYWDFGNVPEGSIAEKIFTVKNLGDEDLIIERVITDCGCTTADISSKQIVPKSSAELKAIYNTKGKPYGQDSKNIYIFSNDSLNPKAKITVVAEIISAEESHSKHPSANIPVLTSQELYDKLGDGEEVVILDVREENEYLERHIPEAVWFPKSKFDRNDKEVLAKLKSIDKVKPIVSYCGAGHRSSYVTKKLREKGYNAYNLDGISFWEKKGYPLIRGPKLPPSQEPSIIHLEEAYEHYFLLFKDIIWIDVRNKEDYNKGHVKGALGIPLSDLEYNLGRISKDKEIVLYCEGTWGGGKCDASMSAGRILIKNGFKPGKIKVFEDGYGSWENAGYPTERGGEND
jgi:rhodanese-related sulfurtransferase